LPIGNKRRHDLGVSQVVTRRAKTAHRLIHRSFHRSGDNAETDPQAEADLGRMAAAPWRQHGSVSIGRGGRSRAACRPRSRFRRHVSPAPRKRIASEPTPSHHLSPSADRTAGAGGARASVAPLLAREARECPRKAGQPITDDCAYRTYPSRTKRKAGLLRVLPHG